MHRAAALRFVRFGASTDPLLRLDRKLATHQARYLRCYLHDLEAHTIIVEPSYFDRDYLSEFSAFYATSAAGYPNVCQRLHFFSRAITRDRFRRAAGGDPTSIETLRGAYLGFIVLRPIPGAPFGKTVLRTYPDDDALPRPPRVTLPSRTYEAHLAGLTLRVDGLAWQQQDAAVGACATVALWSMLHSSAFDDHHAIPTTADITAAAHWALPDGSRVFPAADGLHIEQMLEAVKSHGLAPIIIRGEQEGRFSPQRFCTLIGSFLRSGYPVLVNGVLDDDERAGHAVCVAGFRPAPVPDVDAGEVALADGALAALYVHDDNLGPNARFVIGVEPDETVVLRPRSPPPRRGDLPTVDPTGAYHEFIPTELVVAVHAELRTAPVALQRAAVPCARWIAAAVGHALVEQGVAAPAGLVVSTRFIRLHVYVEHELASVLRDRPRAVLAEARLAVWERVPPMSLHVGLVRIGMGGAPLVDLLFDTSDNDRHLTPTAHVVFHPKVSSLLQHWCAASGETLALGLRVRAW